MAIPIVYAPDGTAYTNLQNLPPEIVHALLKDRYTDPSEAPFDESASTITAPTQQVILKRRYKETLILRDVMHSYWAFLGSIAHQVLEDSWHKGMKSIAEKRFYLTVKGKVLSGKLDCYESPEIRDYKTTKVYKMMRNDFVEWEQGQNVYAYLLKKLGYVVTRLNVWAFLGDWKEGETYKKRYPQSQIVEVPLRLWSMEEQEAYIHSRLDRLEKAAELSDEEIVKQFPCTKKEMWQDIKDHCIFKDGAKKATKVFHVDDETEGRKFLADNYGDKPEYKFITRWTDRTRCLKFCDCANHCGQHKALCLEEMITDPYANQDGTIPPF